MACRSSFASSFLHDQQYPPPPSRRRRASVAVSAAAASAASQRREARRQSLSLALGALIPEPPSLGGPKPAAVTAEGIRPTTVGGWTGQTGASRTQRSSGERWLPVRRGSDASADRRRGAGDESGGHADGAAGLGAPSEPRPGPVAVTSLAFHSGVSAMQGQEDAVPAGCVQQGAGAAPSSTTIAQATARRQRRMSTPGEALLLAAAATTSNANLLLPPPPNSSLPPFSPDSTLTARGASA